MEDIEGKQRSGNLESAYKGNKNVELHGRRNMKHANTELHKITIQPSDKIRFTRWRLVDTF
jgi:hypothetical protein